MTMRPTIKRRVALAWQLVAIAAAAFTLVSHFALPAIVKRSIRNKLAHAGYANARFSVSEINAHSLELDDVWLGAGLDLGHVEVHASLWQLWRGGNHDISLRGSRIDMAAVSSVSEPKRAELGRITIEDAELTIDARRVMIAGTIDLRQSTPSFDLVASAERFPVGSIVVHDAVARVRGHDGKARACASGSIESVVAKACADLPTLDVRRLDAIDVSLTAQDSDRWMAEGHVRLVRGANSIKLENGHVAGVLHGQFGAATFGTTSVYADIEGDLTDRTFALRGNLDADYVKVGSSTLREVELPFALTGSATTTLRVDSEQPLRLQASTASLEAFGTQQLVTRPSITVHGQIALADNRVLLSALDDDAMQFHVQLHDLALDPWLRAASHGRLEGTGIVDGSLDIDVGDKGWSIASGSLQSRGNGTIRITDAALRNRLATAAKEVPGYQRVAAALSDFETSKLGLVIGEKPDLQLELRGQGKHVPQQIDVVLNVRGAREIANRLAFGPKARK